ncbi:hypothetical protein AVEN_244012-1 [Araneus ventricosus]|uniref:Uncharacterized protein n=1 Tax=Araneus ventricosus TaxID=182803 RepID=A0A4Y2I3R3_ARAVE|nr:hypothetical protein AVEN_244012-1 [Araneus ventricosus]
MKTGTFQAVPKGKGLSSQHLPQSFFCCLCMLSGAGFTHFYALAHQKSVTNEGGRQDLDPAQAEATREADELPGSNPSSKKAALEIADIQKDRNRESAVASFTPRFSECQTEKCHIQ